MKSKKIVFLSLVLCSIMILGGWTLLTKGENGKNSNEYGTETLNKKILNMTIFTGGEFNGVEYIGQSMVHRLGFENAERTVVMIPGHGLSSYIYTSTPDGRSGWTSDFSNAGYDTFAVDTNNLAVSGFEIKDFGTETQPKLSTWGINKIWKTWGFGDKPEEPYKTTQYPVEYIEKLYASFSPMVSYESVKSDNDDLDTETKNNKQNSTTGKSTSSMVDMVEVNNTIELLEEYGPSVLIVHSMGGMTGFEVVRQRPDLVTAIVVIEPVGSPTNEDDLKENFIEVPYLAVYGDYIESRGQTGRYESCNKTASILNENGGFGEVVTLTDLGIEGNTHLMMQDKNSSDIAKIIIDWLDKNAY